MNTNEILARFLRELASYTWIPVMPEAYKQRTARFRSQYPDYGPVPKNIMTLLSGVVDSYTSPMFYVIKDNPDIFLSNLLFSADRRRGTNTHFASADSYTVLSVDQGAIPDDLNKSPRLPHTFVTEAVEKSGLTILSRHTDKDSLFDAVIALYAPKEEESQ